MAKHYVTFGQIHRHIINGSVLDKDSVACYETTDNISGRTKAFELFGDKFFTDYHEELELDFLKFYPRGIIHLIEPYVIWTQYVIVCAGYFEKPGMYYIINTVTGEVPFKVEAQSYEDALVKTDRILKNIKATNYELKYIFNRNIEINYLQYLNKEYLKKFPYSIKIDLDEL